MIKLDVEGFVDMCTRYCAKLPSDAFTHLTPKCRVEDLSTDNAPLYRATLQLPINSPIKEPVVVSMHATFRKVIVSLNYGTDLCIQKCGNFLFIVKGFI